MKERRKKVGKCLEETSDFCTKITASDSSYIHFGPQALILTQLPYSKGTTVIWSPENFFIVKINIKGVNLNLTSKTKISPNALYYSFLF